MQNYPQIIPFTPSYPEHCQNHHKNQPYLELTKKKHGFSLKTNIKKCFRGDECSVFMFVFMEFLFRIML